MNMSVNIAGVEWKNPVTVASGTFGSGAEYSEFADLNKLGAVTTKGVANVPWAGNPTPRVAEVYGGMLLGVPLMAVIYYVAQKTVSYFLKKRGLTTDTLAYVYLTKVDKESNQPVYDKNPSKKELKKQGVDRIEDVFYCVPEKGHLLVIKK